MTAYWVSLLPRLPARAVNPAAPLSPPAPLAWVKQHPPCPAEQNHWKFLKHSCRTSSICTRIHTETVQGSSAPQAKRKFPDLRLGGWQRLGGTDCAAAGAILLLLQLQSPGWLHLGGLPFPTAQPRVTSCLGDTGPQVFCTPTASAELSLFCWYIKAGPERTQGNLVWNASFFRSMFKIKSLESFCYSARLQFRGWLELLRVLPYNLGFTFPRLCCFSGYISCQSDLCC